MLYIGLSELLQLQPMEIYQHLLLQMSSTIYCVSISRAFSLAFISAEFTLFLPTLLKNRTSSWIFFKNLRNITQRSNLRESIYRSSYTLKSCALWSTRKMPKSLLMKYRAYSLMTISWKSNSTFFKSSLTLIP